MDDVRWLNDDELKAWTRLVAVVELLPGVLDSQLRRDSRLTNYEYFVMARLSEAPGMVLRMSELAARTNATLPRLSHVVRRMEERDLVERRPCPEDARATNAHLTDHGWATIQEAAPAHVENVRRHVFDALTPEQVGQLTAIADALLARLDPDGLVAVRTADVRTGRPVERD
jgi:DNA-binding MarR family transcriptional regulator